MFYFYFTGRHCRFGFRLSADGCLLSISGCRRRLHAPQSILAGRLYPCPIRALPLLPDARPLEHGARRHDAHHVCWRWSWHRPLGLLPIRLHGEGDNAAAIRYHSADVELGRSRDPAHGDRHCHPRRDAWRAQEGDIQCCLLHCRGAPRRPDRTPDAQGGAAIQVYHLWHDLFQHGLPRADTVPGNGNRTGDLLHRDLMSCKMRHLLVRGLSETRPLSASSQRGPVDGLIDIRTHLF